MSFRDPYLENKTIRGVLSALLLFGIVGILAFLFWPLLFETSGYAVGWQAILVERSRAAFFVMLVYGWFFFLGASFGSFINVVSYRMPEGISIVSKPSSCPYCGTKLGVRENLPILGWLSLQGRCKTCRVPISIRYLMVELIAGALVVALLFSEVTSGGASLPARTVEYFRGIDHTVLSPKWDLLGTGLFHALLLLLLLTFSLIRFDGKAIPVRLSLFAILCGLVGSTVWPALHYVPWFGEWTADAAWYRGLLGALGGGLVGGLWGLLLGLAIQGRCFVRSKRCGFALGLAVVGTFLGPHASLSIGALTCLVHLVITLCSLRWLSLALFPLMGTILVSTLGQLIFWRETSQLTWWPGKSASWIALAAALLIALAASRAVRMLARVRALRLRGKHSAG